MKNIERRIKKLEEELEISKEDEFQELLKKFSRNMSIPTRQEFLTAMKYGDSLESVDSDWVRELLEKGKKKEWLEILDMIDKLEEERRKLL